MGDLRADPRRSPFWWLLLFAISITSSFPVHGGEWGREYTPSVNDFGTTGLLQMPNARFHQDGGVNLGVSHIDPYTRGFLTLQGLPWLEGTFRYTDISNRLFGPRSFSGDQSFKDRSVDVKILLSDESAMLPQTAVQLRDLGGTDLFGSEFLIASRRYYNWDFTLGLAWGNAGSRGDLPNPFCQIADSFCTRAKSGPGAFNTNFFRGERMAVFGGVEYLTPIEGLRLKLEFDGNDYQDEPLGNQFNTATRFNIGAEYDLLSWFRLSAALERGNSFMIRGNLHANLNTDKGPPKLDRPPPPVKPRKKPPEIEGLGDQPDLAALMLPEVTGQAVSVDSLLEKLERRGLVVSDMAFDDRTAILRMPVESARPTAATLAEAALEISRQAFNGPLDTISFIATKDGREQSQTDFKTADLERSKALTQSALALVEPPSPDWLALFETDDLDVRVTKNDQGNLRQEANRAADPRTKVRIVGDETVARVATGVFAELERQGFKGERLDLDGLRASLYFSQSKYRNPAIAIGRAARILARNAPSHVEELRLVLTDLGIPISETTLMRTDLERAVEYAGSPEEIWHNAVVEAAPLPEPGSGVVNAERYPAFDWSLQPQMRHHIGGPDAFYFFQVYAAASAEIEFAPGLSVTGTLAADIFNTFDDLKVESDSELPHVRSDIKDYLKEGEPAWIDSLHVDYITKFAPDVYGRASAGIFELMFGGVGGEVLYRPSGRRWAVGLDVNYVKQRDFDGIFGFQDYEVATGHLSYYHRLPFHEILATVRAGRYLAKDWGATLELSRTFDNGVTAGVFVTKTDVSAKEFGEGRFDKGFFISIPMDVFFTRPTRQRAGFLFRPLTRDGGQRLVIPKPLYGFTDAEDSRAIGVGWEKLLE